MKTVITVICCIFLFSCANVPEITDIGDDTYILTVSSRDDESTARESTLEKVNEYCTELAGELEVTNVQQQKISKDDYKNITKVTFRCSNIKNPPTSTYKPRRKDNADRPPVWPGK